MRLTFLIGLLCCLPTAHAATFINSDFSDPGPALADKNGRVTGTLPKDWHDNSTWANVWINYTTANQGGRACLEINVTRIDDGRAQLLHDLPNLDEEGFYRLTFIARSPTRTGVELSIRDLGPPYQSPWHTQANLGPAWKMTSIDFRLKKYDKPVRFFILPQGVGQVQFAALRLDRLSREELIAELKKQYPEGEPANLINLSTGLLAEHSGWTLGREWSDGDQVKISSDNRTKPARADGVTSKIVAPKGFDMYSAPFEVPLAFESHTASLYVKGSGSFTLGVVGDGRTLATHELKLADDQWHRVETNFMPIFLTKAYVLMLKGTGTFNIDSAQVNIGKTATPFTMRMGCEVHLSLSSDMENPSIRAWFDDEKEEPRLSAIIRGVYPQGASIKATVTHASGQSAPARVPKPGQRYGQIYFDVFPEARYGPFRIQAWAEDAAGKRISPISEVIAYRLHRPRFWGKDAPDSPFGVHTLSINRHNLMAKAVGINWVRLHDSGTRYIGWRYLEPEKGKWVFDDAPLQRYRAGHLMILGALATRTNWATNMEKPRNGYFDQFWQPKSLEDFALYVRAVTSRYKGGTIDTWDVWNEPWNHEWWAVRYDEEKGKKDGRQGYITSEKPQADFARLVDVAVTNAKSSDPSIKVIGVNSTTGQVGRNWSAGIVEAEGQKLPDVYCYHQYTGEANLFPGDAVEKGFRDATGAIAAKLRGGKLDKAVWMSEGSSTAGYIGSGMYQATYPNAADEDVSATGDRLCRYEISLLANGVSKVFLYSMHSHRTFGDGSDWRVLVTEEGALHPSAAAHSNMAWHLEGTTFSRRIELAPGLNAYLFTGGGRSVAVLSPLPGKVIEWPAPAGVNIVDLYGNPMAERSKIGPTISYVSVDGNVEQLAKALTAGR